MRAGTWQARPPIVAEKAQLQLKRSSDPAENSLKWKWGKGDAFDQADLGAPDSSTGYTFCLYDMTGGFVSLEAQLDIAPGSSWEDKDPKGWNFEGDGTSDDGVTKIQLKTGESTKTKAQLKSEGDLLPMPSPVSASRFFSQEPVRGA